jgi:uncharacterized cupredoxin-like copper-binding protein
MRRSTRSSPPGPIVSGLVVAVLAALSACGSSGDASAPASIPDTPITSAATTAAPTTPAPASTLPPVTTATPTTVAPPPATDVHIGLADFSFADLPDTLPSGVTRLTGTNTGTEEHQATFIRIDEGQTLGSLLGALAAAPQSGYPLATFAGGPQSVAPGESQSVVVDLKPGSYAVMCFIPSPADGVPHVAKGMLKQITVTDSGAAEQAPVPPGDSVVLTNYAFALPKKIAGIGTIRVVNNGDQPHEVAVYRVNEGVDPQEALGALTSEHPSGPPPVTPAGGTAMIQPGAVVGIDTDWAPGDYVVVCFLPDATDGAPHFTKGMAAKFTVSG